MTTNTLFQTLKCHPFFYWAKVSLKQVLDPNLMHVYPYNYIYLFHKCKGRREVCTLEEAVMSVSTVVVLEVISWLHTVPVRPLAFKQLQMRVRWMGRKGGGQEKSVENCCSTLFQYGNTLASCCGCCHHLISIGEFSYRGFVVCFCYPHFHFYLEVLGFWFSDGVWVLPQ